MKTQHAKEQPSGDFTKALSQREKSLRTIPGIKVALVIALLAVVTGCVGYVDGGDGAVIVQGPEVTLFGGPYEGRGFVHGYSHRGFESRGGGGRGGGGHGGGGHR